MRGVNAYIAETERNPALLPIEFRMLGITPGRWTPAVVISRHQALTANVGEEVRLLRAIKASNIDAGARADELPGRQSALRARCGDRSASLPRRRARGLPRVSRERAVPARGRGRGIPRRPFSVAISRARSLGPAPDPAGPPDLDADPRDIGSNNWVVSGSRTISTRPILANDPHRVIAAPSLRYWVHLVAPGWNVIGGGEPVLPGVSIGHNEHGAWGLTIFGQDAEDLYVYDTNPANPNEYRYRGTWEAMRVVTDSIPIKGEKPETVELKYTRHGPVLFEDRANRKAYALRAGWMEPGGAPYLASLRMNQATTWEEFKAACTFSNMPSENMVWVDRQGNIGWQAAGIQPIRRNWSGILPVPGDGRYEWDGYLPITSLPHEVNPARGFIATANNFLMPDDYPVQGSAARAVVGCVPRLAHRRSAGVGPHVQRRRDDAAAERRSVDRARALTPLLRHVPLAESGERPRARSADDVGLRARQGFDRGRRSTRCGSAGCWPTRARSWCRRRSRKSGRRQPRLDQEGDRLAAVT